MPALNRVQLIGRLGKDPESKFTPTGKKVAHFSIAISNRWKSGDGESRDPRVPHHRAPPFFTHPLRGNWQGDLPAKSHPPPTVRHCRAVSRLGRIA